ncbi:hypothetical protein yc1106_08594 [Curvularia clavata]|uniref:Uncharacterized protein n=1 Tax=Curvularia clavata TaxID=95742 RepID=A0A9Q8ZGK1_CURCL|nr:hypothetical protein yc1106_08594 [Curvularia clavata]
MSWFQQNQGEDAIRLYDPILGDIVMPKSIRALRDGLSEKTEDFEKPEGVCELFSIIGGRSTPFTNGIEYKKFRRAIHPLFSNDLVRNTHAISWINSKILTTTIIKRDMHHGYHDPWHLLFRYVLDSVGESLLSYKFDALRSAWDDNDVRMLERIATPTPHTAGLETTSASLAWALHQLTLPDNLRFQSELRKELQHRFKDIDTSTISSRDLENVPILHGIVEECLRLHPPIPSVAHIARRNTEIAGRTVPKGTMVLYWLHAINRSPEQWGENAGAMDPYRWITTNEHNILRNYSGPATVYDARTTCIKPYIKIANVTYLEGTFVIVSGNITVDDQYPALNLTGVAGSTFNCRMYMPDSYDTYFMNTTFWPISLCRLRSNISTSVMEESSDLVLDMTLCFAANSGYEYKVETSGTAENQSELAITWNVTSCNYITDEIRSMLGASLQPQSLNQREIYSLHARKDWTTERYNRPKFTWAYYAASRGEGLTYCDMDVDITPDPSILFSPVDLVASAHLNHNSIFVDILKDTRNPTIAPQAIFIIISQMSYYNQLHLFNKSGEATYSTITALTIPVQWTGFIVVMGLLAMQSVLIDVLKSLPCNGAMGDRLWMGFGRRHIVRTLSSSSQGTLCVAFCGALAECFDEEVAAEILHEMVKTINAPTQLTPSILQWKALIKVCAGILSQSDFGSLVEELIQLNPTYYDLDTDSESYHKADRSSCQNPKLIAEAIQAIGDVSKNKLGEITIVGGNAIGWLAAISEWLFSLSTSLENGDGTIIYRSTAKKRVQVHFVFSSTSSNRSSSNFSYELQCVGKVYNIDDPTMLFRTRSPTDGGPMCGGRLAWANIFQRFFGSTFESAIRDERTAFENIIGSVARMLSAIAKADTKVPRRLIATWRLYLFAAHGLGFVEFITWRFPELAPLRAGIESSSSFTLEEACSSYENSLTKLKITCAARGCHICRDSVEKYQKSERYCQPTMINTIIALALALASTEIAKDLFIKSAGLWRFYHFHIKVAQMANAPSPDSGLKSVGEVYSSFWNWSSNAAVGSGWSQRFNDYIILFYGNEGHSLFSTRNATAVSIGGICIYSKVLDPTTFATFDLEKTSSVYICAGGIEHEGKPYSLVKDDNRLSDTDGLALGMLDPYDASWRHCELYGRVRETAQGLHVSYQMVLDGVRDDRYISLWPAHLAEDIAYSRGWADDSGTFEILDMKFRVIPDNPKAKCAAITVAFNNESCALRGDTEINYKNPHFSGDRKDRTWVVV